MNALTLTSAEQITYTYTIPISSFPANFSTDCGRIFKQIPTDGTHDLPRYAHVGVVSLYVENSNIFSFMAVTHLFTSERESYCIIDDKDHPVVFFEYALLGGDMNKLDITFVPIGEIDHQTKSVLIKTTKVFPEKINLLLRYVLKKS